MKLKLNLLLVFVVSFVMVACLGPDSGGDDVSDKDSSSEVDESSADDSSEAGESSDKVDPSSSSETPSSSSEDAGSVSSEGTGSESSEGTSSESSEGTGSESSEGTGSESSESPESSSAVVDPKLAQCGDKCGDAEVIADHTLYLYEEFDREIKFGEVMAYEDNPAEDWLWTFGDGTFEGNATRFTKENIDISDGTLKIIQKGETIEGSISIAQNFENVPTRNISGGEVRTHIKDFHYGIYKIKMKVSKVPGTGNTFATFFAYNIPRGVKWREIDIEVVSNHPTSGEIITNLISTEGITDETEISYSEGLFAMEYPANGSHDFPSSYDPNDGEWHEYSFDWKPGIITWYIDEVKVRVYEEDATNTFDNVVLVPDMPLAIFMNFWTPTFFDAPSSADWPLTAEYDYIKYYKWDDDQTVEPEHLIALQ